MPQEPQTELTDKQAVAEGFSRAAATYNEHAQAQKDFARKLCLLLAENGGICGDLEWKMSVADLGSGTGFLTGGLRKLYRRAHIYGFDLARAMVDTCRERFADPQHYTFTCLDMEEDDFGRDYRLIASSYAMQWVDCPKVFAKIHQALSPNGVFALALPVAGAFNELEQAYLDAEISPAPMLRYTDSDALLQQIKDCGFALLASRVEKHSVFYPDSAHALRSFRCCGASFTHQPGHHRLSLRQARMLLQMYDHERFLHDGEVAITYNTLYVVARREG